MKKIIGSLLICSIMLWGVGLSAYAAAEHLVIDGTEVTIPQGMGTLRDVDNRTFVPIRYVTEDILNYKLNYGSAQESATITEPKSGIS